MKKIFLIISVLMAVLLWAGCGTTANMPYEPDTEEPAYHEGAFVSEYGTMIFNGDGKSVELDLSEEFCALIGEQLPSGKSEGTYAFVSELPPAGWTDVRYDTAHNMRITVTADKNEYEAVLDIGYPSSDGKNYTVNVGTVTEKAIPLVVGDNDVFKGIVFEKEQ